jgi:polysaccharide chain length determinant protein (PEP-CTERM system associated)
MKDISQMNIKEYWQVILRRRYLFISVSLLCLSIVVWGSFFMPKIYEAKSTVFIESNVIKDLVRGIVVTPSMEERLRVLTFEMISRSMLLKVIDALDLDVMAKSQAEIESTIKKFQEDTKITVKGKDLFIVSYRGRDPKKVRDYVNTLISKYIEENTSSKREEAFSANQFLSEQINYYKKKLEESEERLARFRRDKGVYLAIDERVVVASIREYENEMERVDMEIKKLEAKKEKISQQLSGEEPLTLAMINREESSLSARLKSLEQNLPMLLAKYTENYPEVIRTRAEIETIKRQIEAQKQNQNPEQFSKSELSSETSIMNPVYQQLKEEFFRTESEIDSLKAKLTILNNRLKRSESELKNIPEDRKELATFQRDRDTYQGIYEQLLARLGQAEVSEQMEIQDKGTTFRIVDPAILPTRPVSPNRVKLTLFGIFAGVVAGIGAVLLREYLDSSIRDIDTLKSHFGLQVLAVVPGIITKQDIEKKRKLDRRVYGFSIAYLLVIGGLFVKEVINKFL